VTRVEQQAFICQCQHGQYSEKISSSHYFSVVSVIIS
jgi:hypothetical protein